MPIFALMKGVKIISGEHFQSRLALEQHPANIVGKHFILTLDSRVVSQMAVLHQPYRLAEGRMMRVISGCADYRINLIEYTFAENDIILLPPKAIVELTGYSEDYAVEALVVVDLPGIETEAAQGILPSEILHLSLGEDDNARISEYLRLIARQMSNENHADTAVSYLVMSMATDLVNMQSTAVKRNPPSKLSRGEGIFMRFIELVKQYGSTVRNIPFYADRLALTPNHLSAVVRKQSGMSVMEWLHRTTVTEAKVLLKHSDLMIYEIGNKLNFDEPTAFNRYFKKHAGVTPLEYRHGTEQA